MHVAKDVRVAPRQLVANTIGNGGQRESVVFFTQHAVKDHLKEHVPEFFGDTMLVNGTTYPEVTVQAPFASWSNGRSGKRRDHVSVGTSYCHIAVPRLSPAA